MSTWWWWQLVLALRTRGTTAFGHQFNFRLKITILDSFFSSSESSAKNSDTPPSSFQHSHKNAEKVHLPEPFYPPSITQGEGNFDIVPRSLPLDLGLPTIPLPKLPNEIDPKDMSVRFYKFLNYICLFLLFLFLEALMTHGFLVISALFA